MTACPPAPARSLPPVHVAIRPARGPDAAFLRRWRAEPAVRRWQPIRNASVARLRAEIAAQRHRDLPRGRGDRYTWMIEAEGERAGWITLAIVNWDHGLGEIGYALSSSHHGRGTMTAALGLLLPDLMLRTPLERLEARCAVGNEPSARVLEKLGFVREGTLRAYFVLGGRRIDHHLYALLGEDYVPRLLEDDDDPACPPGHLASGGSCHRYVPVRPGDGRRPR